jgi:hypothetical protein
MTESLSAKERARLAHILISKFVALHKKRIGPITVNRYSAKWGMIDVIDSVGFEQAEAILEYYFTTPRKAHDLEFFYKNFDKMQKSMIAIGEDRARRARIMVATKRRVEEAKNQHRE